MAQHDPEHMRALIPKQRNAALAEQTQTLRASLTALDKRIAELDKLVVAAYEDKVAGRIPEALYIQFLTRYENERREKLAERTVLTAQLDARQEDKKSVDDWIELIRDFAYLDTLDRPTLLRLINRIDVGERREENGQQVRNIKIHYNFVGYRDLSIRQPSPRMSFFMRGCPKSALQNTSTHHCEAPNGAVAIRILRYWERIPTPVTRSSLKGLTPCRWLGMTVELVFCNALFLFSS